MVSGGSPAQQPDELELLGIGAAADQAGTSCRTLRYYEELDLIHPTYSGGGSRRYSGQDVARLRRIRELQELLGFDLGEIGDILRSEDRLAGLRDEFRAGVTRDRHLQILTEATTINNRLRDIVRAKQGRLTVMMKELEAKARTYRSRVKELSDPSGPHRSHRSAPAPKAPSGAASNRASSRERTVQVPGFGMDGVEGLDVLRDESQ